ncbi:MAG: hypothetical protein WC346_16455 [Methanogenium sp.]|jgi:hypothetical protein
MNVQGITVQEMKNCIEHFEKFAKTYFWNPPSSASARRWEEERNTKSWNFTVDEIPVEAKVKISCSCRNYYAYRSVKIGEENKKMMIPFLKKCLSSLEENN